MNNIKNSFRELLSACELLFLPIIFGFIDIINYYPNGDGPGLYGDGTDPFYVSFSLFNCIVVYFLVIIKQYLYDIYYGDDDYNRLEEEYNKLEEEYNKLEEEYNKLKDFISLDDENA